MVTSLIGLAANQTLCLQGQGTPIPLDPTKRLVITGIYAYLSNPMQLSAELSWLVLGAFLQNMWIMAASIMAWTFVLGTVRWHHRNDLLKRFPFGWPDYKANLPEWVPRWHPWTMNCATLVLCAASQRHHRIARAFSLDAVRMRSLSLDCSTPSNNICASGDRSRVSATWM